MSASNSSWVLERITERTLTRHCGMYACNEPELVKKIVNSYKREIKRRGHELLENQEESIRKAIPILVRGKLKQADRWKKKVTYSN